jgi:hypothetical protein
LANNNFILNRFFTQNILSDLIYSDSSIYGTIIRRFVANPKGKKNKVLISEIYRFMSKEYRNEYFYQNTLLNKLLLGIHSVNTTTALTQLPISKSKADFILINGKAVVYEIKTELDSFERLTTQLNDYYKSFNHVCIVTSENQYESAIELLKGTSVGIYVLTKHNTISSTLKKEPIEDNSKLEYITIFKILRKKEFESILLEYYNNLPTIAPVFYYTECFKMFSNIPIENVYSMFLKQLKKRNNIQIDNFIKSPYELKSLLYFANFKDKDWKNLDKFLNGTYGG